MLTLGELKLLFLAEIGRRVQSWDWCRKVVARAHPQAGPAEALLCLAALFYSEKQIDGGVAAAAEDGGDVPALRGCPDSSGALCWLCKPSSAPCLAPALKLGQGAQSRHGPISCRAGFLHSSPLWYIYTMSALELVGARVDAWRSLSVVMQRWRGAEALGSEPSLPSQSRECFPPLSKAGTSLLAVSLLPWGCSLPLPLSFPRQRSLQSALSDGSCRSKSTSPALMWSEITGSHHVQTEPAG